MNCCQYLFLNNVRQNADLMFSSIQLMETLLTELVQATWSHMPGFSTTSIEPQGGFLKPQPNQSRNRWPNPQKNCPGLKWAVAATFHSGVKRSTYYGTISLDWVNSNITLQDELSKGRPQTMPHLQTECCKQHDQTQDTLCIDYLKRKSCCWEGNFSCQTDFFRNSNSNSIKQDTLLQT